VRRRRGRTLAKGRHLKEKRQQQKPEYLDDPAVKRRWDQGSGLKEGRCWCNEGRLKIRSYRGRAVGWTARTPRRPSNWVQKAERNPVEKGEIHDKKRGNKSDVGQRNRKGRRGPLGGEGRDQVLHKSA